MDTELEMLAAAIREQRLIHIMYCGRPRYIEAYALGKDAKGQDVLVGRQYAPWVPGEQSWQVFEVGKIYGLLVLDKKIETPGLWAQPPAAVMASVSLAA